MADTRPEPALGDLPDFPRQLYTPAEAGEWLSVKEDTVRGLHRAQKLTGVKVGKHLRFRRGDLQRYVEELAPEV